MDDTQLCPVLPENPKDAVETMNGGLEEILGYIGTHEPKLNPEIDELRRGKV